MSRRPLRLYVINVISSTLTRLLQLTVLVWVNQYLLRRIAPEEYSLFPVVMSLLVFAEIFRHIFTGGLARFLVEADARGDHEHVTRITSSMLPALAAAAGCFAVAATFAIWHIDAILRIEPGYVDDARLMLGLQALSLCAGLVFAPFTAGPYVRQKFVVINGTELATEALRVVVLLYLLFNIGPQVRWLVVASALSAFVALGWRMALTRRMVPAIRFERSLVDGATARKLMSFGAWTSVEGLVELVAKTAPLLFLNRFSTPIQVACFHVGRVADVQMRRVIAAAAQPAQPALTSLFATGGRAALHDFYYRGGRYLLWLSLLLVGPLVVLADPLMILYAGSEYVAAGLVMLVLLSRYPFVYASSMYYRVSHATGSVRGYYVTQVVIQLSACALTAALVIGFNLGALGAALAISATEAVLHVVLIWPLGLQMIEGRWGTFFRRTVFPGLLPFLVALAVCAGTARFVNTGTWLGVGLCTGAGVLAYVVTLLSLCLDTTDRALVRRAWDRALRRRSTLPGTVNASANP